MLILSCSLKADLDSFKALLECSCSFHYKMYLVLEYSFNNSECKRSPRSRSQDWNFFMRTTFGAFTTAAALPSR